MVKEAGLKAFQVVVLCLVFLESVQAGEIVDFEGGSSHTVSVSQLSFPDKGPFWKYSQTAQEIFIYQVVLVSSGSLYGHSPLGWGNPTLRSWYNNISQAPEYPDGDGFFLNYIAHPIMGAHMFIFARHNGFNFLESFMASTLGQLLWEYGMEAPFERPSRSDLMVTSTVGGLLGSMCYWVFDKIDRSPAGKRWYGKLAKFVINPFYIF